MKLKALHLKPIFICMNLSALLWITHCNINGSDKPDYQPGVYIAQDSDTIRKVVTAMLSMQRRAWEQGVAAQALHLSIRTPPRCSLMPFSGVSEGDGWTALT
jgi:hypothetical protein